MIFPVGDGPLLTIHRVALHIGKCVYVALADVPVSYPRRESRIVYIGGSEDGAMPRCLHSLESRAPIVFRNPQINSIAVRAMAHDNPFGLEDGLLKRFLLQYGALPLANGVPGARTQRSLREEIARARSALSDEQLDAILSYFEAIPEEQRAALRR
jgi:hypothetical protein